MTLPEMESLIEKAVKLQHEASARLAQAPGRMNLLDLVSDSRLENYHSDVIAFLVNPSAAHRHEEYGNLFLDTLNENGLVIEDRQVFQVEREKTTTTGRRIDILVHTPQDVIIVENKVDAGDLPGQLRDYIEYCETKFASKNVFLVYLTLDGHEMSEESLADNQKNLLVEQQRAVFASYSDTILPWLEKLTTRVTGEESLRSAVMQYQDAIKGLYKLKEAQQMAVKHFFNHFYSQYEGAERHDFQTTYGATQNLQRAMEAIHLIKVLAEIHDRLEEAHGSQTVYMTLGQRRYFDYTMWIEHVDIDTADLGVELALESDADLPFGLAVEISVLSSSANFYYGIMSHGQKQSQEMGFLKKLNDDSGWSGHTFRDNSYWHAFTRANWARDRILSLGSESDGRMSNGRDIVEHIVQSWFS